MTYFVVAIPAGVVYKPPKPDAPVKWVEVDRVDLEAGLEVAQLDSLDEA